MNPDSPQSPREELELRLTVLLLGELPDAEAAALRETLAHDPELARLHDRLAATLGLIREATPLSAAAETAKPEPLTLDPQRREVLLKLFKKPAAKIVRPTVPFWTQRRRELTQLAAMIVALISFFLYRMFDRTLQMARSSGGAGYYVMEKVGEPPAADAGVALVETNATMTVSLSSDQSRHRYAIRAPAAQRDTREETILSSANAEDTIAAVRKGDSRGSAPQTVTMMVTNMSVIGGDFRASAVPRSDSSPASGGVNMRLALKNIGANDVLAPPVPPKPAPMGGALEPRKIARINSDGTPNSSTPLSGEPGAAPSKFPNDQDVLLTAPKEKPVALGLDMVTDLAAATDGGGRKPGEAPAKPKEMAQLQDRELPVPALRAKTAIALPEPAAAEGVTEYRKQAGKEALGKDMVALGNPVHWTESGRLSSGGVAGGGGMGGGSGGGARGPQAPASPAPNSGVTTYDLFAAYDSAPSNRGLASAADSPADAKKDAKQLADGTAASFARGLGERGRTMNLTGLAVDAPTMPADGVTLAGRGDQNKAPVLGDLPVAGRLFQSESKLGAMGGEESKKAGGQPAAGQANSFGVNGRGETTLNFASSTIEQLAVANNPVPSQSPAFGVPLSRGSDAEAKQKAPVASPSSGGNFYSDANRNTAVEFGREAKGTGGQTQPLSDSYNYGTNLALSGWGGDPHGIGVLNSQGIWVATNSGIVNNSWGYHADYSYGFPAATYKEAAKESLPDTTFAERMPKAGLKLNFAGVPADMMAAAKAELAGGRSAVEGMKLAEAPVSSPVPPNDTDILLRAPTGTTKQDGFNLDVVNVAPQGATSKPTGETVYSVNAVGYVNLGASTNAFVLSPTPATGNSTLRSSGGDKGAVVNGNVSGISATVRGFYDDRSGSGVNGSTEFTPPKLEASTFKNDDVYAEQMAKAESAKRTEELAKGLKAESSTPMPPSQTLRLPPAPAVTQPSFAGRPEKDLGDRLQIEPSGIPPQGGTVVNDPQAQDFAKLTARSKSDANGREAERETLRRGLTRGTTVAKAQKQLADNLGELNKDRPDSAAQRLSETDKKLGEVEMLSEDVSGMKKNNSPTDNLARLSREKQAAAPEGKPAASTGTLVQDGKQLFEMRNLDDAEVKLKEALTQEPDNKSAYYYLSLIQEARYGDEAKKRDFAQKTRLMEVEKAWTVNLSKGSPGASTLVRTNGSNGEVKVTAARNVGPGGGTTAMTNAISQANDFSFYSSMAKTISSPVGTAGTLTITELAKAEPAKSPSLWQRLKGAVSGNVERTARVAITKETPDGLPMVTQGDTATFTPYFVEDQADKLQSDKVLNGVIDKLDLKSTWSGGNGGRKLNSDQVLTKLRNAIEVRPGKGATDFDIVARSDNPEEAARIANAIAEVYRQQQQDAQLLQRQRVLETYSKEMAEVSKKMGETLRSQQERKADSAEPETPKPVAKPPADAPVPQPEISAAANAFSTFSLNVSDVSFKLAAASLEKGVMPDVSTLRAEEFLNALDYHDPEPTGGARLAFAWERARDPFAHDRDYLRFSVKTAASGRQAGRPLNLVLLLDNSGSMERADRVLIRQECLRVLAGQLQAGDRVSVIAFARTARLFIDGLAGEQAAELPNRVGELTPEGGTNLEDAMNLAWRTAARHYLPNGMNRVVLLTDGAANLGDVDPASLKKQVEAQRKQGMALDCFGIGWDGYNDDLLEALSRNGDGRYGFINTPEAAAHDFAGQLAGALKIAASDVKVQVEWNPRRVTVWRQIGYAKHQLKKEEFRDNKVDAAEIAAQEAGNALYTVQVNPAGEGPLGVVRVRYKVPGTTDYREHEWPVPYEGAARPLEQGSDAMRLAATSSAFSEWLASSPFAGEVTPDGLLGYLNGVPERYAADPRPKQLEAMIRQARSLVGK